MCCLVLSGLPLSFPVTLPYFIYVNHAGFSPQPSAKVHTSSAGGLEFNP